MDDLQERALARGLREGRTEAWRDLYEAYAEPVWRAVARWMGPPATDVADVVQEIFLAAARSAGTYDAGRGSLKFWLWGIARRQVALYYRKRERLDRLQQVGDWLAAHDGPLQRCLEGREEAPPEILEAAELAVLVRATLLELPADYESLLTAKYLDGVSIEQIASDEKSTSSAVRSKLARAREAFRKAFAQFAGQGLDSPARGLP
jgi:RNA polymerase sigma-70 factor (ECF subfamily)